VPAKCSLRNWKKGLLNRWQSLYVMPIIVSPEKRKAFENWLETQDHFEFCCVDNILYLPHEKWGAWILMQWK
jgi:hypothetical protein